MELLIQFFKVNEVIVYSIYGQVFCVMGIAIAVHSMQHSRLHMAGYLWLLAGFGLTHGLVEWGFVFIPIQGTYMPTGFVQALYVVQLLFLVVSFLFLLVFGAGLAVRASAAHRTLAVVLPTAAWVVATGATTFFVGDRFLLAGEVWARYLLATPACLLTGFGLLREGDTAQAMGLPRIARYLRVAAGAVWVYGLFSGLVTPAFDSLPARWVNDETLLRLLGLPSPVMRSLAALIMAYGIIRSLDVFRVETDRLLQEARDQKLLLAQRELAALSAVGVAVGQSRELHTVLANGLERVLEILRLNRGAVFVSTGQPPEAAAVLCHCVSSARSPEPGCSWCQCLALEMLTSHEPVVLMPLASGEQGIGIALAAGGVTLGAMTLHSLQPLQLSPEGRELLTSIGHQIGVAVENARLWEEVRRKEAVREELLQRIIYAQEEERKRIARGLHDETGQALTALVIQLGAATEALPPGAERARGILDQTRQRLRQALQEIRRLISDLRPTLLDDLGLVPALRRYLESTGAIHGLRTSLRAEKLPARLPSHLETALYRIVQEGVTNAIKHAAAGEIAITVAVEDGEVVTQVRDNGRGFDPAALDKPGPRRGFGLLGMQERVALLGGTLVIRSELRRGTELVARIPLGREVLTIGHAGSAAPGG